MIVNSDEYGKDKVKTDHSFSTTSVTLNNNDNNSQEVNEHNCFIMIPKLLQQFILAKRQADSLKHQVNSNVTNKTKVLDEINELNRESEVSKNSFLKAIFIAERMCNGKVKDDALDAYLGLGNIWYNKAVLSDVEYYYMTDDKQSFEAGKGAYPSYLTSLDYFEKAYEIDEENQDALRAILSIRKMLKLDEYNPTFVISSNDIVKYNPDYKGRKGSNMVIKRVIISDNQTIVEFSCVNKQDGRDFLWITIHHKTYLEIDGQKYYLTKAEGIEIAPQKTYYYNANQTKEFALYFPAIPKSTKTIDLIEPGDSDWKFYGIKLK